MGIKIITDKELKELREWLRTTDGCLMPQLNKLRKEINKNNLYICSNIRPIQLFTVARDL